MTDEVYGRLREQLDQYGVGFPSTPSGVEMKILKKLFTEEEAQMFLHLSLMGEPAQAIADRLKKDRAETAARLDRMADKGLLFRLRKKDKTALYAAIPFVIGIYEFQVGSLDKEMAVLMEQYFEEAFSEQITKQTPPLRPIAVNRSFQVSWNVAPYEDARQMVKGQKEIAVAKCICRMEKALVGDGCDKPLEVCLSFGPEARYYVDLGVARWIGQEEALNILDRCDEAGLVPQPTNSQNPVAMCNCCGDCCGVLRSLKKHPRPSEIVLSNYYAQVDAELCTACETCLDRCQMEAIDMGADGVAVVDLDRCIGCGLCVSTCPTEALCLKTKEPRREPPVRFKDAVIEMARERGTDLIPMSMKKA